MWRATVDVRIRTNMDSMLKYFGPALIFAIVSLALGFAIGGFRAAWIVLVLAGLETALSFDNAVVNARVLQHMDAIWRRRFLLWGMLIAVFVMRLIFPILVVCVAAHLGPIDTITLAIQSPNRYASLVLAAHDQIAAFGGAFLLLVFFRFFVDSGKKVHWIARAERLLLKLGKLSAIEIVLTLVAITLVAAMLPIAQQTPFLLSGIWGVICFVLVDGVSDLLGGDGGAGEVVKTGLAGFTYLEMLDASFSFDGVVGAFAVSNNLFLIMLGLGAGAIFVRSFTLMLVEKGTLNRYRYLEHGAFWAIGALALILLTSVFISVPQAVTGGIGLSLIVLSWWTSIYRKEDDIGRKI